VPSREEGVVQTYRKRQRFDVVGGGGEVLFLLLLLLVIVDERPLVLGNKTPDE
jgi:hypothetical protein